MKNLIKLQGIVMSIEEDLDTEYKSTFDYKNYNEMIINSYCWRETALIKEITETLRGIVSYLESNDKIRILDIHDKEGEE